MSEEDHRIWGETTDWLSGNKQLCTMLTVIGQTNDKSEYIQV